MRYLKQTTFIFTLCGIILGIPAMLGGCTAEDETDSGNGTVDNRIPLIVRATATSFAGLPETEKEKDDTPLTRTPVENGNTTTFTAGDAIGIFVIRNGAIADGISNAKLTYNAGASGTSGSWIPEEGAVLYWHEGVSYVAYYPYKYGISIEPSQSTDQIIASLAANGSLQPTTNQSGAANYTACDLMTASGTPMAEGGNPLKQVLTLNFEHQFALLIVEPQIVAVCAAPTSAGFTYRPNSKAPVTDSNVKSAIINSTIACRMVDGTYRALVKPTTGAGQITGSYLISTESKKVSFSGSSIPAGFTAGNCYKAEVIRSTPYSGTLVRPLAPGDFVFHGTNNIEVYPGNGLLTSGKIPNYNDAVGIVVTCDKSRMTDKGCKDDTSGSKWDHAYVMGLVNCGGRMNWGPSVDEDVLPNTMRDDHAEDNMNGYTETEAMLAKREKKGDLSSYGVFNAIDAYRYSNPVPAGLSSVRSPWFVPSVGQWFDVMANICGRSPKTFRNLVDDDNWADSYYGTEMLNTINSQLNKVGKPLSLITVNGVKVVSFSCSSEMRSDYNWNALWRNNGSNVRLGFVSKSGTLTERVVRPFFAF